MTYKSQAIILKRTNLGEADRLLTIYTPEHGKIKAIAKGVRKTLSKLAGHLELFCVADLVLAEGKNFEVITGAETRKCFINLRQDSAAINTAYYIAEIIDKMTAEHEKNEAVSHLLDQVLENLDNGKSKLLLSYFELNFLAQSGYLPELYACVKCHQNLNPENIEFDFQAGGLAHQQCAGIEARQISAKAIKILRLFLKHDIQVIQRIKSDKKLADEVIGVTRKYIEFIAEREFKSKRFLPVDK